MFEDTKGVIISPKWTKEKQYNDDKKEENMTTIGRHRTTQTTKN